MGATEMGTAEPDWARHQAPAGHLADMPLYEQLRLGGNGKTWTELVRDAPGEVRVAAAMPDTYGSYAAMEAAALAVWCDQPGDPGLLDAVEALAATVNAHNQIPAWDRARIRRRLLPVRPEVPVGAALDVTLIRPDDGWSRAVLGRAARWQGDRGRASQLLRHLMTAAGSKPSRRWLERAATLLQDPGATRMLRYWWTASPPPNRS